MNRIHRSLFWPQFVGILCLSLTISSVLAFAQQSDTTFEPVRGQPGKDVMWVPTPKATVDNMLKLAKITPQDYLIDLGSGDGVMVISAAKLGVRAHGIEYNRDLVILSRKKAAEAGVSDKATFAEADLFQSDFSKATVLTMFLGSDINLRLRPTILDMKPGTRIVSNSFGLGDWIADETITDPNCSSFCTALLWIVPAKVEGTWKLRQGELRLTQIFQNLTGTLGDMPVTNGKMAGDRITFEAGGARYDGRVDGNTIKGTVSGNSTPFTATR